MLLCLFLLQKLNKDIKIMLGTEPVSSPAVNTEPVSSPAVNTEPVSFPVVSTKTISSPAVSSGIVNFPAVSTLPVSSPAVSTDSNEESEMCKICHCGKSEASLIAPCR